MSYFNDFADRIKKQKEERRYLKEIEKAAYAEAMEELEGKTLKDKEIKAVLKGREKAAFKALPMQEKIKIMQEKQRNMYVKR